MPDEQIPGTLNVGHVLPTVVQAIIYTQIVEVEFTTLALHDRGRVRRRVARRGRRRGLAAPQRADRHGPGAASARRRSCCCSWSNVVPGGGTALALGGTKLAIGIGGNFVLGALMTLGIGLYAPCMILISLLGMNPTAAFPIMMGSCAFLMPVGSMQFVRKDAYNLRAALGLAIGGPLAVLIAAFIVKSLPLFYVRWLVVVVVIYTASTMLQAAAFERRAAARARS